MKRKVSFFTLLGALACLASMFFAYVTLNLGTTQCSVGWMSLARIANKFLFAVPILGGFMLISAFANSKFFKGLITALCAVFCFYFYFSYGNILTGDLVKYLLTGNSVLSSALETGAVDVSDISAVSRYLTTVIKPGIGAIIFSGGTVLSLLGVLFS